MTNEPSRGKNLLDEFRLRKSVHVPAGSSPLLSPLTRSEKCPTVSFTAN